MLLGVADNQVAVTMDVMESVKPICADLKFGFDIDGFVAGKGSQGRQPAAGACARP